MRGDENRVLVMREVWLSLWVFAAIAAGWQIGMSAWVSGLLASGGVAIGLIAWYWIAVPLAARGHVRAHEHFSERSHMDKG